ncbi:MAG TPA: DUF4114 domain-containing protein, partial [Alphaproteobacteria bacterium]|nr:DUF4114 domain-containing protein [Alphaproteobacteria bacterium]
LVNGVNNQLFLTGNGTKEFNLTLRDAGYAGFDNAVGVYEVDQAGDILDARLLFDNANADKTASTTVSNVEAGHSLGFFIVQDAADWAEGLDAADTFSFVNTSGAPANVGDGPDIHLAVNGAMTDETVFHSYSGNMNEDGLVHALSGVEARGEQIVIGFEDLTGGGDRDYEDVVFVIEPFDSSGLII